MLIGLLASYHLIIDAELLLKFNNLKTYSNIMTNIWHFVAVCLREFDYVLKLLKLREKRSMKHFNFWAQYSYLIYILGF